MAKPAPANAFNNNATASDKRMQYSQMLNEAVKESKNPEAAKLKGDIDEARKQRSVLITRIKESRRRLSYKETEGTAISKLLEIEKGKDKNNAARKKIGYLLKLKNKLEFKISTEASSLSAEKDLVRQIESVNKELAEAYRGIKLERKSEFIKKDISEYRGILADLDKKIVESDKKLDELYSALRKILGISRDQNKHKINMKKKQQQAPSQEINLEDIAIIKKKEKKEESDEF